MSSAIPVTNDPPELPPHPKCTRPDQGRAPHSDVKSFEYSQDLHWMKEYLMWMDYPSRSSLNGYNDMVRYRLKELLSSRSIVRNDGTRKEYTTLEHPVITRPSITHGDQTLKTYPSTAFKFRLTYAAKVYAIPVTFTINEQGERVYIHDRSGDRKYRCIMSLPVMVGSCLCHLENITDPEALMTLGESPSDPRGYFIYNGQRKFMIYTEKLRLNRLYVFPPSKIMSSPYCRVTVPSPAGSKQMQLVIDKDNGSVNLHMAAFKFLNDDKTHRTINIIHAVDILDFYFMNSADGRSRMLNTLSEQIREQNPKVKLPGIIPAFRRLLQQFIPAKDWPRILTELGPTEDVYSTAVFASGEESEVSIDVKKENLNREALELYEAANAKVIEVNEHYDKLKREAVTAGYFTAKAERELDNNRQADLQYINDRYVQMRSDIDRQMQTLNVSSEVTSDDRNRRMRGVLGDLMRSLGVQSPNEWQAKLYSIFTEDFFPNISPNQMFTKINVLLVMTAELLMYKIGKRKADDMDSWSNKKVDTPGSDFIRIIRGAISKLFKDTQTKVDANYSDVSSRVGPIANAFKFSDLDNQINKTFTGSGGDADRGYARTATISKVEITNWYSMIDGSTRITVQINQNSTTIGPRSVQPNQKAFVCPAETRDDSSCGLVKHMGATTIVTIHKDYGIIYALLHGERQIVNEKSGVYTYYVLINSIFVGWADGPSLNEFFIQQRRKGKIYIDAEIVVKDNKVEIYTDAGRLVRPVLVVGEDGRALVDNDVEAERMSFETLFQKGYAAMIGVAESEYVNIAPSRVELRKRLNEMVETAEEINELEKTQLDMMDGGDDESSKTNQALLKEIQERHDILAEQSIPYHYLELHPLVLLGINGALIPNVDKMHNCRVSYTTKINKQAMVAPPGDPSKHEGTQRNLLYPTRKLVTNELESLFGLDAGTGTPVNLLIGAFSGYDQEDSIVMNERTAQLKFRYMVRIKKDARLYNYKGVTQVFAKPALSPGEDADRYRYIDENGMPSVGAILREDQCVIGKIQYMTGEGGKINDSINASVYMIVGESGIVESVRKVSSDIVSVIVRHVYTPQVGNKFSPECSQKSVIGKIIPHRDMPWSTTGETPDMIMSPMATPSRMTISQLLGMLMGTVSGITGRALDATGYRELDTKNFERILYSAGYLPTGEHVYYNPYTGKPMKATMYSGHVYYQALIHLAHEKIQHRGRGQYSLITGQPYRGKRYKGAVRFSEMDMRALLEYGATEIIRGRLCKHSDAYKTVYCVSCGIFATTEKISKGNESVIRYICPFRCGKEKFGTITIPYILKLLIQQLASINLLLYSGLLTREEEVQAIKKRFATGNRRENRQERIEEIDEMEDEEGEEGEEKLETFDEEEDYSGLFEGGDEE